MESDRNAHSKETHSPPLQILNSFFTSIQSPEGLKRANMKKLYRTLVYLSSNCDAALSLDGHSLKLKNEGVRGLSNILFNELESRFNELFSALRDASPTQVDGEADVWAGIDDLVLLLRCCLVSLILVSFDQTLLLDKGRVLLSILGGLISVELSVGNGGHSITFKKLSSRQCVNGDCTRSVTEEIVASIYLSEPSNPCCTCLCRVLEVFADELLAHKPLLEYFMLIDSASSKTEMLFNCHFGHGSVGCVLEVICAHFVLSVSDEQAFENFLNRLFWCYEEDLRAPEISLAAALSLLLNPIISSVPKTFQAYLILLVSEVIGICLFPENKMDIRLVDLYLKAFEISITLYSTHMSGLHVGDYSLSGIGSLDKLCLAGSSCQLMSESFLQMTTRDKLCQLDTRLKNSLDLYSSTTSSRASSDMAAASILYVKDNLPVFEESYRDKILLIMSVIVLRGLSDATGCTLFNKIHETSPENLYFLASLLKLMGCSMLQAMSYLRHVRSSCCLKSLEEDSHKLFDTMVNVIRCFEQFNVRLPLQIFLQEAMQSHPNRHKESKWMLFHFSGLLSLSYASGLDFLAKNCLFIMMTLLNFFIIEEGDFNALGSLLGSNLQSFSSESANEVDMALVVHKTSRTFSSKTQKIQETYLRTRSLICSYESEQENRAEALEYAPASMIEVSRETCNGSTFLKCISANFSQDDVDDLADFIECRQGKDYSGWLRNRQRFNEWKWKKTSSLRWKKKKKSWSYIKGK